MSAAPQLDRQYVLTALQSAALRAQLLVNEIDLITIAVRDQLVSPEAGVMWARDCGALNIVGLDDAEFDADDMLEPVP